MRRPLRTRRKLDVRGEGDVEGSVARVPGVLEVEVLPRMQKVQHGHPSARRHGLRGGLHDEFP